MHMSLTIRMSNGRGTQREKTIQLNKRVFYEPLFDDINSIFTVELIKNHIER